MSKAPKEQTELLLTGTLIGMGVAILTPFVLFTGNLTRFLYLGQYEPSMMLLAAGALFLGPTYFSERYSNRFFGPIMRFAFSWFIPILAILAICPSSTNDILVKLSFFALAIAKVALARFRNSCRPSHSSSSHRSDHSTAKRLSIMICGDAFPPKVDGVATFSIQAAQLLQDFGHTVRIVTSIKGPEKLAGAQVTRLPGLSTSKCKVHSITVPVPQVLAVIQEFKPDVVHLFEVSLLNLSMLVYCWIADVPVTFSHHTRVDLYADIISPTFPSLVNQFFVFVLQQSLYPLSDGNLAVCGNLFDRLSKYNCKDVRLWSSGVDPKFGTEHFSMEMRNYLSNGKPDVPLVIHVGRLALEKNSDEIPDMIDSARRIIGAKNVRFAVIGDGVIREDMEQKCNHHIANLQEGDTDLDYQVKFAGFLHGKELLAAYASADCFFSPSTTEAFPLVYLEAMSSGLAVAGPRAGGVPDAFNDGQEGCVFEPHDINTAGKAIATVVHSGKEMKAKALSHGNTFTWMRSIRELEGLLLDVVGKKSNVVNDRFMIDRVFSFGRKPTVQVS